MLCTLPGARTGASTLAPTAESTTHHPTDPTDPTDPTANANANANQG